MTVIEFPKSGGYPRGWQATEKNAITGACSASIAAGTASGLETGATEVGDPQFYLLGPPPRQDCILCISRLGRRYVLEDGCGTVLFVNTCMDALTQQMRTILHRKRASIVARVTVLCCCVREFFHEKVEPLLVDGEEMLAHVAPQLVALA
jgi:hypothetical protein